MSTERELRDERDRQLRDSRLRAGQQATGMNAGVRNEAEERQIEANYEAKLARLPKK